MEAGGKALCENSDVAAGAGMIDPEAGPTLPSGPLKAVVTRWNAVLDEGVAKLTKGRQAEVVFVSKAIVTPRRGIALLLPGDEVEMVLQRGRVLALRLLDEDLSSPAPSPAMKAQTPKTEPLKPTTPKVSPMLTRSPSALAPRSPEVMPASIRRARAAQQVAGGGEVATEVANHDEEDDEEVPSTPGAREEIVPKVTQDGSATDGTRHKGSVKVYYKERGFGFLYETLQGEVTREVYFRGAHVHESVILSRSENEALLVPGEEVEFYITAITSRGAVATHITISGYTGVLDKSPGLLPENELKGEDDDVHIGAIKMFNAQRKYGFIVEKLDKRVGGKTQDFFFNETSVIHPHIAGLAVLLPGDVVNFKTTQSSRGLVAAQIHYLRSRHA